MSMTQKLREYIITNLMPIDNLAPGVQERLLAAGTVETFAIGTHLFEQGDNDDRVYYLLVGRLKIQSIDEKSYKLDAATEEARYPLANLRPRQYSAKALSAVQVLSIPKPVFDDTLAGQHGNSPGGVASVSEQVQITEQGYDWMTSLLQSHIFSRIPTQNILKVLSVFEEIEMAAGSTIITEGEPGDYYYLIKAGRLQVSRKLKKKNREVALAELREGHGFGEEALLSESPRNATVRAITSGRLMRIKKGDFLGLIRDPTLRMVTFDQVSKLVREQAVLLDVRLQSETTAGGLKGALHLPLHLLREGAASLDPAKHYIVYCDNGTRSAIAAFLLLERGFNVSCIRDGIHAELERRKSRTGDTTPQPAASVLPASIEDIRQLTRIMEDRSVSMDELSRSLSVVLANVYRQLEQALQQKSEAERARLAAEAKLAEVLKRENAV